MRTVLLIGLGRFGRYTAAKLNELNIQIMAIDHNEEHVNKVLNIVTNAQLWNAYTVFISHLCNLFILHSFSMGYRRIGLHYDTLRLAIFNKVQGSVGDMAKHLIYHGFDLTAFPKIVNVFSYEV